MCTECIAASLYSAEMIQAVEVSGWDADGQFFVEIADLDVGDSDGTVTRLCHRVLSDSLVFARLISNQGDGTCQKGLPTAYEVQSPETPDFSGRYRVQLNPCQPRIARWLGDQKASTRI